MRTFWAIVLAALAGLLFFGAAASVSDRDSGSAMWAGLLGGALLMGALVLFRRPTDAEREAKEARLEARRERQQMCQYKR